MRCLPVHGDCHHCVHSLEHLPQSVHLVSSEYGENMPTFENIQGTHRNVLTEYNSMKGHLYTLLLRRLLLKSLLVKHVQLLARVSCVDLISTPVRLLEGEPELLGNSKLARADVVHVPKEDQGEEAADDVAPPEVQQGLKILKASPQLKIFFRSEAPKLKKKSRGCHLGLISSLEKEQTEHEIAIFVRPVASVGTPVVLSPESSRTFAIAFICVRVSGPRGRSAAFATLIPWRSKLICRRRSGVGQVVRAFS